MSAEDSGLPNKLRRNKEKIRCWKEGWIEETHKKLSAREIEII